MKLAFLYQQSEPPAKDGTKELAKIKEDCVAASQALKMKGLVRIDCREDKNGVFKIFDFNAKPNITGGVRPHRKKSGLPHHDSGACRRTYVPRPAFENARNRLDRVSRNATVLCTAGVRRIKKALSFTLNALYVFVQHI